MMNRMLGGTTGDMRAANLVAAAYASATTHSPSR
jgi:hypothetical protein